MFRFISAAAVTGVLGALALAPGALAAPPAPQDLNPPAPDFYTCKPLGGGTICRGSFVEIKDAEPQPELVCGSGADAFLIHDNGRVDSRATRWYDADGNLTKRVLQETWSSTFWSNPLSGKVVPYHQRDKITTELTVPGDFDSAIETTVGSNMITDPVTHRKVLYNAGRTVFGADGSLESSTGHQPFVDAFVNGDMSVFDDVCAALA
jgi:hypothetical protein